MTLLPSESLQVHSKKVPRWLIIIIKSIQDVVTVAVQHKNIMPSVFKLYRLVFLAGTKI